jgi:hypothetical protein
MGPTYETHSRNSALTTSQPLGGQAVRMTEVRILDGNDLVERLTDMRVWLDEHRYEPSTFTYFFLHPGMKIRVRKSTIVWIGVVRPSRRPLHGLLRMRNFLNAIKALPHAESAQRARLEHAQPHRSSSFAASVNFLTSSKAGTHRPSPV